MYRPQCDTELLGRVLESEGIGPGTDVLDLGTGSALALRAAGLGARSRWSKGRVTTVAIAADDTLSRRTVLTARLNAVLARQRVSVRRGAPTAALPATDST
ncbi:hypothetical protein [Streptomyces sp. NPDC059349]|uniref:hypothetical protein n=1 Tax=Streptomyces sp. NPDC059349 TaxID=3346808 RepID=UPI0036C8874D